MMQKKIHRGKHPRYIAARNERNEARILSLSPTPLRFYSNFKNGIEQGGKSDMCSLHFMLFLLLPLLVSFMNLATRASERRHAKLAYRKS